MNKLKKEELEKLKIDVDDCIKLVKEISANYDSGIHYNVLTQSIISSVNSTINSITNSTIFGKYKLENLEKFSAAPIFLLVFHS